MLQKILNNKVKIVLVALLVFVLALIRAFEGVLFYDPFSAYFKNDYLNLSFPAFKVLPLFWAMSFRYFLNSALSLAVI